MKKITAITLFLLAVLVLSTACRQEVETETPELTEEITDSIEATDTQEPTADSGETETPAPTETDTPEPTEAVTSTPTEFVTIELELCETQLEDMCVLSLYPVGNDLAMNLISNLVDRGEKYFLIYENEEITCELVENSDNQYYCEEVPQIFDRTIFMQVFEDEEREMLLAEGQFFFSQNVILGPVPTTAATQKATPPDPYNP